MVAQEPRPKKAKRTGTCIGGSGITVGRKPGITTDQVLATASADRVLANDCDKSSEMPADDLAAESKQQPIEQPTEQPMESAEDKKDQRKKNMSLNMKEVKAILVEEKGVPVEMQCQSNGCQACQRRAQRKQSKST